MCWSAGGRPRLSLHIRWTTLGADRHVDLWTKLLAVHMSPGPGKEPDRTKAPAPGQGRGPRNWLERPSCRAPPRACEGWGVGGSFFSGSSPAHGHDQPDHHRPEADGEVPRG